MNLSSLSEDLYMPKGQSHHSNSMICYQFTNRTNIFMIVRLPEKWDSLWKDLMVHGLIFMTFSIPTAFQNRSHLTSLYKYF